MKKTGLSRPGASQMVTSAALVLLAGIGPIFLAATRPSQEWLMVLTGFPALALSLVGVGVILLYIVGFLRYCKSKGYSMWLGLCLLVCNVFGFIALLLLPDLNTAQKMQCPTSAKALEVTGFGREKE